MARLRTSPYLPGTLSRLWRFVPAVPGPGPSQGGAAEEGGAPPGGPGAGVSSPVRAAARGVGLPPVRRPLALNHGRAGRDARPECPHWQGFAAGDLIVPEVAIARRGGAVALTLSALIAPDDDPAQVAARLEERAAELRTDPLPLLDPDPAKRPPSIAELTS